MLFLGNVKRKESNSVIVESYDLAYLPHDESCAIFLNASVYVYDEMSSFAFNFIYRSMLCANICTLC